MIVCWPVDGDCDHAEERAGDISVEEEREEGAEGVAENPALVPVPRGGHRQVDGAEEQVGETEADDKRCRRMLPQLWAPQQGEHRHQISYRQKSLIVRCIKK